MENIVHPPRTGMEVFKMLPEGTLCQLINDTIIVSPAPLIIHQSLSVNLITIINRKVTKAELGYVFSAPIDVYLNCKNAYQPDILFISNKQKEIIKENGIYGAPELIIEILSKGSAAYDRGVKKEVYEEAGMKELWLVNPLNKRCEGFLLQNGKFVTLETTSGQFYIQLLDLTIKI